MKSELYLSQGEIHTVAAKAAPGDLGLKFHPKGLSTEIDILIPSPIQVLTETVVA